MSSRNRGRIVAIVAIAASGAVWPGTSGLADVDDDDQHPIVVAEVVVAEQEESRTTSARDDSPEAGSESQSTPAQLPIFVPRTSRGAPAARIGGGARSAEARPVVRALVPEYDDAALTIAEQPKLQWHLSQRTEHPVNFTLVDPEGIDPIVDVTIPGPFQAGFHRIDLSSYGARLEAGRRYHWFVAVVVDPDRRSADVLARGSVERVIEPAPLAAEIAAAQPRDRARVLAGAGLWYDALEAIDRQMPSRAASEQRDALLAQVGIDLGGKR